jgi:O-antigen ligase
MQTNLRKVFINFKNNVKYFLYFTLFFIVFFLYQKTLIYDNLKIFLIVNTLVLVVFLLSVFKIKLGFYLFVFFIPLLNSLTAILHVTKIDIILFLFFSLFLGFYINIHVNKVKGRYEYNNGSRKLRLFYDSEIARPSIIFIIISSISCLITIFRYSNFYPLVTNRYHDLIVNINGISSTWSILWTTQFFFNCVVGFGLFFIAYYILDDVKDIIISIIILIFSNLVFTLIGFYQYFINPYFGNTGQWAYDRINATFSDPNALGSYIVILFPIYIAIIIFFKKWYLKILFIFLLAAFLIIAAFCGSRSAFLGIILSLFIFFIVGLPRLIKIIIKKSKSSIRLKRLFTILTVIILIIIVLFCSIFISFCSKHTELKDMYRPKTNIALFNRVLNTIWMSYNVYRQKGVIEGIKSISSERFSLWAQSLQMFKDYPISGVGIGAYVIELPDYYIKNYGEVKIVDFAGNYYLQILSELGIAGLFLVLFIFYLIIKKVFAYLRYSKKAKRRNNEDRLLIGFFVSFITMAVILFLGPHTNFNEVQFTFWLIIGLMISYIKIKDRIWGKAVDDELALKFSPNIALRTGFDLTQRISLIVIIFIFAVSLLNSSFSDLSINIKQNLYGWENNYGFYKEELMNGKKFRWTNIDASEIIKKEGQVMVVPVRAGNPDIFKDDIFVRFYIDNSLMKIISLKDDNWHDAEIDFSDINKKKMTFTVSVSRSWTPKEWNISNDSRELGIMVGETEFINN